MDTQRRADEDPAANRPGDICHSSRVETMTREELHKLMLHARTLEQCAAAWQAQEEYLCVHPDDESVIEEGEALWMREQALKSMAGRPQQEQIA